MLKDKMKICWSICFLLFLVAVCPSFGRQRQIRQPGQQRPQDTRKEEQRKEAQQSFPGVDIVGTCSPPFRKVTREEDEEMCRMINEACPDIVWVGLGAPKQEQWMADHEDRLNVPIMIGVGAAFDFHSGNIKWAPRWIRNLGMEWAYRLALEPRRMWRRNLDSPLFLMHVLLERIKPPAFRSGFSGASPDPGPAATDAAAGDGPADGAGGATAA